MIDNKSSKDGNRTALLNITKSTLGIKNDNDGLCGTLYRQSGSIIIIKDVAKTTAFGSSNTISSRGAVTGFSARSSTRMRGYLRECISDYPIFVTLTYPCGYPCDGEISKGHLRRMLTEVYRFNTRNGQDMDKYSTFWFLEFQGRGAPHYHLFTTNILPHDWLAKTWYRIVGSEDERHLHAGTSVERFRGDNSGVSAYAVKYALKTDQKTAPEGYSNIGRYWGVVGCKRTKTAALLFTRSDMQSVTVQRSKIAIDDIISTAIKDGDATLVIRKPGVAVIHIDRSMVLRKIRVRMHLADAVTSVSKLILDMADNGSIDNSMDIDDKLYGGGLYASE